MGTKPLAPLLVATCLISPGITSASTPFTLISPVKYANDVSGNQQIQDECDLPRAVENELMLLLAKHNGGNEPEVAANENVAGKLLRVTITGINGRSGGSWTGSKGLVLNGELLASGTVTAKRQFKRNSGSIWGSIKSTCDIAQHASRKIARDLYRWASDQAFRPDPSANSVDGEDQIEVTPK